MSKKASRSASMDQKQQSEDTKISSGAETEFKKKQGANLVKEQEDSPAEALQPPGKRAPNLVKE